MATSKPDLTTARIWANSALASNVIDPGLSKYANGWIEERPFHENFNYIQQQFSQASVYNNEQGINGWDTNTVYPINALVKGSDGEIYRSLSEQSGNDPTSTTRWISLSNAVTNDFINRDLTALLSETIHPVGFSSLTSGGSLPWVHNNVIGQTPSQTPAQLGDALFNDAAGNQWALVHDGVANLEDLGGVGDGTTDNNLIFTAFLNSGIVGILENNTTYATGQRATFVINESGFISNGHSKILMLSAGFNATTYAGLAANSVGFSANGIDKPIFKNIHIEFEAHGTDIRTAIGIALRDCTDIDVDIEASGFSEPEFGIVTIDSCIGGRCFANVHDCSSDDNTLPSLQITGVEVDENRINSVYSQNIDFGNPTFKNLTFGPAALAQFGSQTDGITFSGGALGGGPTDTNQSGCTAGIVTVENVYEAVDIQSSNHIIAGIKGRDILEAVLKIVNAGQNNNIGFVNAENTGANAVLISGSNTSSIGADNNTVGEVIASRIASIAGASGNSACVHFSGGAAAVKPNNNKILSVTVTDSPNMLHTVLDEAGILNKVLDVSGQGTTSLCNVDGPQQALQHVDIRKSSKTFINAFLNVNSPALTDGTLIPFDTIREDIYSELDTSSTVGEITSISPMRGRISATIRTASLNAGDYIGISLVENGIITATSRQYNDSGGAREAIVAISANFNLDNQGETLRLLLRTNAAGGIVVTGNSELTTLSVEEI